MRADYIVHFDGTDGQEASMGSGSIEVVSHIAEREAARLTDRNSDREFTKRHFQHSKAKLKVSRAFRPERLSRELVKKEEDGAVGFSKMEKARAPARQAAVTEQSRLPDS